MSKINLQTKASDLSRVGKTAAVRLKKLGIVTARDLLFHFPFRYVDFSKIISIGELEPGIPVTVKGTIESIAVKKSFRCRMQVTEAFVVDDTGSVKVVWFNQPYISKILREGDEVYVSGEPEIAFPEVRFTNPQYEKAQGQTLHTGRIVPMYPLTQGLTHKQVRFLMKQVIELADEIPEYLPFDLVKKFQLLDEATALRKIHFPDTLAEVNTAQQRLKFDEVLRQQIKVQHSKKLLTSMKAAELKFFEPEIKKFVAALPFQLTEDQRRAAWSILQDTQKPTAMNRLVEGDVGSGKTVVAAIALLNCALNNRQAVIMAPTEVLALQHHEKIFQLLKNFNVRVALVTRAHQMLDGEETAGKTLQPLIASGEAQVIVGTHAIITDKIKLSKLGLAVVDEQHRFGVDQRREVIQKSGDKKLAPHFLSMTATPIPRTLALILYGDLDVSVIRQMPHGRKPIITQVVPPAKRGESYAFIKAQIQAGKQAFVICPLVDPSDKLGVKSVTSEYARLQKEVFPDTPIGLLHGQMKTEEKEQTMRQFKKGELKILVATSIIEVGVDIPNATVMIIEGAERFGLTQLHQFRGRAGRSDSQSYCFVFSDSRSPMAFKRLQALVSAKDSFELAQLDLELRGPGDAYGTQQSGFPEFRLTTPLDIEIMQQATMAAAEIVAMEYKNFPALRAVVEESVGAVHRE